MREHDPFTQLEEELAMKQASLPDLEGVADDVDIEFTDLPARVEHATEVMRNTAILLEYLSNEDFCKNVTKSQRAAIDKQVERVWAAVQDLESASEELDETEDEAEDEEDE